MDMIYQQEKEEIFLIPNVQTHKILTEDGDTTIISNSIGQGEVLMNSTSQYDAAAMKVITTRLISSKKLREQQLTLNLRNKRQSTKKSISNR
jgi:hypothetical protein